MPAVASHRKRPSVSGDKRGVGNEMEVKSGGNLSDGGAPKKRQRLNGMTLARLGPAPQRSSSRTVTEEVQQEEEVDEAEDDEVVEAGEAGVEEESGEGYEEETGEENDEEDEGDESTSEVVCSPPDTLLANIEKYNPSKQKHAPGAIVRVRLTDFVTYTKVEFNPGPSLNMVIGPNGTGKSTLVCAICLGLGWGPQVSLHDEASGGTLVSDIEVASRASKGS